jgi:hypothetical protein
MWKLQSAINKLTHSQKVLTPNHYSKFCESRSHLIPSCGEGVYVKRDDEIFGIGSTLFSGSVHRKLFSLLPALAPTKEGTTLQPLRIMIFNFHRCLR